MFKKIGIKNFRTHKDSLIELTDVTLLIGSNNSGKSNFLTGLHYFSRLISQYYPAKQEATYELRHYNYYQHKHSLSVENEPICFECVWAKGKHTIDYFVSIFPDKDNNRKILCTERLLFTDEKDTVTYEQGYDSKSTQLLLRRQLNSSKIRNTGVISDFFQDCASFYYYNLQPSFLKAQGIPLLFIEGKKIPQRKKDYIKDYKETKYYPNVASELGREGSNLQELLQYIKEYEEETYSKFLGYIKRFVKNFNGLIIKDGELKWQFDMGGSNFPYFDADKVSDGLIKAGAVALLCSLKKPPALIMLEEVENGINQRKLSEFLSWLSHASENSERTQFILTTHSPSVIREFSNKLDTVYNIHLRERNFTSIITNINEAIKPLVNMGTIEDDGIIERNGKEVIKIRPHHLIELFYNGVLGEL